MWHRHRDDDLLSYRKSSKFETALFASRGRTPSDADFGVLQVQGSMGSESLTALRVARTGHFHERTVTVLTTVRSRTKRLLQVAIYRRAAGDFFVYLEFASS